MVLPRRMTLVRRWRTLAISALRIMGQHFPPSQTLEQKALVALASTNQTLGLEAGLALMVAAALLAILLAVRSVVGQAPARPGSLHNQAIRQHHLHSA